MVSREINFRARFVVIKRANVLLGVLSIVLASWSISLTGGAECCVVRMTILNIRMLQRR